MWHFLLLTLAPVLASCAGFGGVRQNGRVVWERSPAVVAPLPQWPPPPAWVGAPPNDSSFRYFVGEFEGDGLLDEALVRAWASGMFRAGVAEFPSVADVEASGEESLYGARFQRRFAVALGAIDWSELDEARELGSPVVQADERTGRWRIFRLLKWPKSAIEAAREKLRAQRSEPLLAARTVPRGERHGKRPGLHRWIHSIASGGRCRGDVDLALDALGPPDRLARETERPDLRHYFWGAYRLTAQLPDRRIVAASRMLGDREEAALCVGAAVASRERFSEAR
jgi:hypothetical protein